MHRKTMLERYQEHTARREEAIANSPKGDPFAFYERYLPPFNYWGNITYVGDNWCSSYIVDTGDGLVMLDSGCPAGSVAMLIQTIWEAGFNPRDVKYLIIEHCHIDHAGGANFMKNMFGTKLICSRMEADVLREHPEWSAMMDSSDIADCNFIPDIEVEDGETLTIGNTTFTFMLTPGHTPGAMAVFFNATDGQVEKRAGFFGAHGLNTVTDKYLTEIGDSEFKTREVFLDSIKRMRQEQVDIFVSGHTGMNKILAKLAQMKENPGTNLFDNPENWDIFCDNKIEELELFIQDPTRKFRYGAG